MNARRFYREVWVEPIAAEGYRILLDGKPVLTPGRASLAVPHATLADAIAAEWRAQGDAIRPETMILTKLANTALDQVCLNREAVIAQILAFAKSDLLCYRADHPETLVRRQASAWDPLLDWARTRYGANLAVGAGIVHIEQPTLALAALEHAIGHHDGFVLAGLLRASTLLGSAVIALALLERHTSAERACAVAQVDELYQAERWGEDGDTLTLFCNRVKEISDVERFFLFLRN